MALRIRCDDPTDVRASCSQTMIGSAAETSEQQYEHQCGEHRSRRRGCSRMLSSLAVHTRSGRVFQERAGPAPNTPMLGDVSESPPRRSPPWISPAAALAACCFHPTSRESRRHSSPDIYRSPPRSLGSKSASEGQVSLPDRQNVRIGSRRVVANEPSAARSWPEASAPSSVRSPAEGVS